MEDRLKPKIDIVFQLRKLMIVQSCLQSDQNFQIFDVEEDNLTTNSFATSKIL